MRVCRVEAAAMTAHYLALKDTGTAGSEASAPERLQTSFVEEKSNDSALLASDRPTVFRKKNAFRGEQ